MNGEENNGRFTNDASGKYRIFWPMAEVCKLANWCEMYTSSDKFIYEITNGAPWR